MKSDIEVLMRSFGKESVKFEKVVYDLIMIVELPEELLEVVSFFPGDAPPIMLILEVFRNGSNDKKNLIEGIVEDATKSKQEEVLDCPRQMPFGLPNMVNIAEAPRELLVEIDLDPKLSSTMKKCRSSGGYRLYTCRC